MTKRNAEQILNKNKNLFNTDFENNKKNLVKVADIPSKKLRNLIAGYITKLKKLSSSKN